MSELLRRFSSPDSLFELPGGRVATWRFGSGPDLILVHGFPVHSATWRHLIPELSRHFTVHLLDLPGAGRTEWSGKIDVETAAETVRSFVDSLGTRRYGVMAHDSGGAIARLACAGDERLGALVMGNTEIPGHHGFLLRVFVTAARLGLAGPLLRAIARPPLRNTALGLGPLFTDPGYMDGEFEELFLAPLLADPEVQADAVQMLESFRFEKIDLLAELHPRIHAPTLCIWGPDDPFFPVAKARAMLRQFGGPAELVEIPRGKLFVHEDHATEFLGHALPFLRRTLGRAPGAVRSA